MFQQPNPGYNARPGQPSQPQQSFVPTNKSPNSQPQSSQYLTYQQQQMYSNSQHLFQQQHQSTSPNPLFQQSYMQFPSQSHNNFGDQLVQQPSQNTEFNFQSDHWQPSPQQRIQTINAFSPFIQQTGPVANGTHKGQTQVLDYEQPAKVDSFGQGRQTEQLSPHNEDFSGYFLPDFIENEIGSTQKTANAHVDNQGFTQKVSQIPPGFEQQKRGAEQYMMSSLGTTDYQLKEPKICIVCNQMISLYEHSSEVKFGKDGMPGLAHTLCLNSAYENLGDAKEGFQTSYQSLVKGFPRRITPQPSPQMQINLTPDMLVFDFQLLHPITQTQVFSLSNQSTYHVMDQQSQKLEFNKLLCNSTAIPYHLAIAKIRWDFFKDPSQMYPFSQQQSLPALPSTGDGNNHIMGLINFKEMQDHVGKNLSITLKTSPKEINRHVGPTESQSELQLNFNYFKEAPYAGDQETLRVPIELLPNTHILNNLFVSLVMSFTEFETLKTNAMKLIAQNPNLQSLLKPMNSPFLENQRFVQTQPGSSLHQLYEDAVKQQTPTLNDQACSSNTQQFEKIGMKGSTLGCFGQQYPQQVAQTQQPRESLGNKEAFYNLPSQFPKDRSFMQTHLTSNNFNVHKDLTQDVSQVTAALLTPDERQQRLKPNNDQQRHRQVVDTSQKQEETNESSTEPLKLVQNQSDSGPESSQMRRNNAFTFEVSAFEGDFNKRLTFCETNGDRKPQMKKNEQQSSNSVGGSPRIFLTDQLQQPFPSDYSSTSSYKAYPTEKLSPDQQYLNPGMYGKQIKGSKKGDKSKGKSSHSSHSSTKKSKKSSVSSLHSNEYSSKGSPSSSLRENEVDSETNQLQNELRGQIVDMARQQHGSKYLQKLLARASPDFVGFAIDESVQAFHQLMTDQYGNYFCQKLLQSSSSAQRHKILKALCPNVMKISCDKKGTHSMQCLIEMINMPEEEEALKHGIKDHIVSLALDHNGTHVLQKVLLCMKEENIDFIFDPVFHHLIKLSMDQNGLCVIKKMISKIQGHHKKMKLGERLSDNVVELVQSPYGNYAVQQALDNWSLEYCIRIFQKLEPHLMQLSVQKFSSNVIEKVLEKAEFSTIERYQTVLSDFEVMKSLIKNQYGFYVLQKLMQVVKKHGKPVKKIQQAIEQTICYASDKSLRVKWQALLNQ